MSGFQSFDVTPIPTTDDRLNLYLNDSILDQSNESILNIRSPQNQPHEVLAQLEKEEAILNNIQSHIVSQIQLLQIDEHVYNRQISALMAENDMSEPDDDNSDSDDIYSDNLQEEVKDIINSQSKKR